MTDFKIVALDGPGGVGKSTTGTLLAERMGYFFLSSGRIYRAMAWLALRRGWNPDAGKGAAPDPALLEDLTIEITGGGALLVNGEDPGDALSSGEIAHATSVLATQPAARERSTRIQRETVQGIGRSGKFPGVILEGRDIGTEVFPDTPYKFFITASPEIRARRRYEELKESRPGLTLKQVTEALAARDARDSERELAPLRPAGDAVMVDTSHLTLEEVVEALVKRIQAAGAARP